MAGKEVMSVNPEFDESLHFDPLGSNVLRLQTKYPVVAASRVRLRPFAVADVSRLVSLVSAHRIADATLPVPRPLDPWRARQWIDSHALEWRKRCAVHWAVSGLENDWLGGYVGLHDIQLEVGRANLSFWIAERLWRKDFGIEATQAALAFAFTSLQLETVQARQLTVNPLVTRILRRLGMKPDTAAPRSASRSVPSEELLAWNVSRNAWTVSLQDAAAY